MSHHVLYRRKSAAEMESWLRLDRISKQHSEARKMKKNFRGGTKVRCKPDGPVGVILRKKGRKHIGAGVTWIVKWPNGAIGEHSSLTLERADA